MIEDNFGWKCLRSEESPEEFWGSNVSACLNAVSSADLFIGIFWKRYGLIVPDSGLPMTEMEFCRALNLKKPMKLFVVESRQVEPSLRAFLNWVKHEQFLIFCNPGDLLRKVEGTLRDFSKKWPDKSLLSSLAPPLYIDQVLSKLDLLPFELCIFRTEKKHDYFDKDLILSKLKRMKAFHELYDYEETINEGWHILNILRLRPPENYPEIRNLWISFLIMWEDACNWFGYIQGSLGSLWAALALRELYRLSEAWSQYISSANIIASNLYALATLKEAKTEHKNLRTWQNELSNQARQMLNRSLDYVNYSLGRESYGSVSAFSIRGNIYRKLGDYDAAIKSHLKALGRSRSDESRGMQMSHIGRAKVFKMDKDGLKYLEDGVDICKNLESPSVVRALKALSQGLIGLKDYDRAEETCLKAFALAEKKKLGHQLESLRTIKELLETIKKI